MIVQTDFLIIGSGIAGLSYALKVARTYPDKRIIILCKAQPKETNTRYAQGGIAAVSNLTNDSCEKHIEDTLKAGGELCDRTVVEVVVTEGPKRVEELIRYGVNFDKTKFNSYDLAREGGHSCSRIFHKGDYTGLEIEKKLLADVRKVPNIKLLENTTAIDLITDTKAAPGADGKDNSTCYGAFILRQNDEVTAVLSKITLLATGGVGQVFEHTTNSPVATGDGIAMAARAGAEIRDMEFIQFHPTALYEPGLHTDFLVSEAVRGLGAILRTPDGESFMQNYDKRKDLATRDVVSRAIDAELRKHKTSFVFLDCRHISKKEFVKHFPTITTRCINLGIDPAKKMIPIVPSAHYCCGGIVTDIHGRTSVQNLYAVGECASTGLHGSNRLASNSLLEALVFAHRACVDSVRKIRQVKSPDVFEVKIPLYCVTDKHVDEDENYVKAVMSRSIGITTTNKQLKGGEKRIQALCESYKLKEGSEINTQILKVRNMADSALLILKSASERTINTGVFYNLDLLTKQEHKIHDKDSLKS